MDFIEIAKKRYSVRSYMEQKVEPEKLEKIIEAAHVAPTAANQQPVHLLVVQSEEGLAKISVGNYAQPLDADGDQKMRKYAICFFKKGGRVCQT